MTYKGKLGFNQPSLKWRQIRVKGIYLGEMTVDFFELTVIKMTLTGFSISESLIFQRFFDRLFKAFRKV
ncbi:hypothetical protein MED121_05498 [Marinomonas sp. MED121]|nr:hypothetical protein MED121_05498 [Marinomonas sp. MED121]